jgi:isopenicillin-N N-acyltransferase like protein
MTMKKYIVGFKVLFVLFCITSCNPTDKSEVQLLANGDLRYIELEGSAYERGMKHGKLLKSEIKAVTDSLLSDIEKTTNINPRDFISKFLSETDFISEIKKWTPKLLEEIKGISDGSGIDYEIIFMHQLGDEFFFNTEYIMAHKCSSIGINRTKNHSSIAAQNMDIPKYFHGYQTVMKIKDENGIESIILTIPGHIGITGMNNKQVSVNCNILMQLDYQRKGLPVSFIVRGILNTTSAEQAVSFLNRIEHASGQNYLIGGKDKVLSLECSATKIAEFKPFKNSIFTYHTNHPMINKSFSKRYLEILAEHDLKLEDALTFCQRIPSFKKRFNEETDDFDIEEIKEVLSSVDHAGDDVISNNLTYASVIYVLSENPKFIIAPGKPHEKEYIELKFK